jgi:hypothetical protein
MIRAYKPDGMQSILKSFPSCSIANKLLNNLELIGTSAFKSPSIVENITLVVGEHQLVSNVVLTTLQKYN